MTSTGALHTQLSLVGAPRVLVVDAERVESVTLALAHARRRLRLPAFAIHWASRLGASMGEAWWYDDGRVEVCLNTTVDVSKIAWVLLHEACHVSQGRQYCGRYTREAEDAANEFAFAVTDRETDEFLLLNRRRLLRRR